MSEPVKTIIFAVVALIAGVLAWFTSQQTIGDPLKEIEEKVGQSLFENFDPIQASSLKIIEFNEDTAELSNFEVRRNSDGLWTLPSKSDYPADAESQVADAATTFSNMKILDIASTQLGDRETFGVIEPNVETLEVGDEGVGTQIQIRNETNEEMVNLVIGKRRKGNPDQRYVRIANADPIYVVEFDESSLDTDFVNWINSDLLQVSANDIETLGVRDYDITLTANGAAMKRDFDADLQFDVRSNEWTSEGIFTFEGAEKKDRNLAANEELDVTSLNTLKNTVDTLRIANVRRKPAGLAADLKAEKSLLNDQSAQLSLYSRGFFPQTNDAGVTEILASNGELIVGLNSGVEYVLRFGERGREDTTQDKDGSEDDESVVSDDLSLQEYNRFVLVTARVNESYFPDPILDPLPESIDDLRTLGYLPSEESSEQEGDETADETEMSDSQSNDEDASVDEDSENSSSEENDSGADADKANADESSSEASEETKMPEGDDSKSEGNQEQPVDEPEPTDGSSFEGSKENTDEPNDDTPSGKPVAFNQPPEDESEAVAEVDDASIEANGNGDGNAIVIGDSEDQPNADVQPTAQTEEELKELLAATREKLQRQNQRKLDEIEEQREKAERTASELNARFADWYYEIDNGSFEKLQLTIDKLIKQKAVQAPLAVPPGLPQSGLPGLSIPGQ